jgi:hypothetical protein
MLGSTFGHLSYLEPVATPLAWLVAAFLCIEHLHHETLTRGLDTVLQQILDFIEDIGITELCKLELTLGGLE